MHSKQYTLEELVDAVNSNLNTIEHEDKRVKPLTKRRVIDYIGKGLVERGENSGIGNKKLYSEEHLKKLIEIREMAFSGLTEKSIKSYYSSDSKNKKEKQQEVIEDIKNKNNKMNTTAESILRKLEFNSEKPIIQKHIKEYDLTDNISIQVKNSVNEKELDLAVKNLETLIKNRGDKL